MVVVVVVVAVVGVVVVVVVRMLVATTVAAVILVLLFVGHNDWASFDAGMKGGAVKGYRGHSQRQLLNLIPAPRTTTPAPLAKRQAQLSNVMFVMTSTDLSDQTIIDSSCADVCPSKCFEASG